jgi:hypothetical protein
LTVLGSGGRARNEQTFKAEESLRGLHPERRAFLTTAFLTSVVISDIM